MRRDARRHATVASQQHQAGTEIYWEYRPNQAVMTIDGPGRVTAVHDGPFPGSETYEVALNGGLGGGTYSASQIVSGARTEASTTHTAAEDYPELGNLLHERPDPATMRYQASLTAADTGGMSPGGLGGMTSGGVSSTDGMEGSAQDGENDGHTAWNPGEYNNALYHDWRQASVSHEEDHPGKVYLRFGQWPEDERSENNVTGHREDGVSVYDLDHKGEPMDPDPHLSRYHVHDQHCDDDCEEDQWNEDYGNDAGEEMKGRVMRGESARRQGYSTDHPDTGHLVKGKMVGIGHDGEPLLHDVKKVGDWIDHRHHFIHTAEPHHLARHPEDEDYEPYEGEPHQLKLFEARSETVMRKTSTYAHVGNHQSGQIAEEMEEHGLHGPYAYQGDGATYCHSCAEKQDFQDHDGPMHETSWSHLRHYGSPHGEQCDECSRELTPPREHTSQECEYGEDCESHDEAHEDNERREDHRQFARQQPERFVGEDLDHLKEEYDRSVTPRGPGEAPLHLPSGSDLKDHWGSEEDFDQVKKAHQNWAGHLDQRDKDTHNAEDQINSIFSGPEFAEHKNFLHDNERGPTHLSQLAPVTAHETWRGNQDDPEAIREHLIDHHGQDPAYIGWGVENHHDRLHEDADDEDYMGAEPEGEPHDHHDVSQEWHPQPWEGRARSGGSSQEEDHRRFLAPGGGHAYEPVPRSIQSLNALPMLITASQDPSFRFHFTAAWRDVQSKAVRIRKSGGVSITHVSDGFIIANVKGDHHVYETGLQRFPGRRMAVAVYSCGCKWGAYHWGAQDDLSRFAGRMCSHALALQYEAQSKGMFGRDITVEDTKPSWVPSKVVVKYDIDDGRNIQARSLRLETLATAQDFPDVPEQSPLMVLLASVNDMFGDASSFTEPAMTNPLGPTSPPNPTTNPTSAGPFTTGEPTNWGSIGGPTLLPGVTSTIHNEAFIQAIIPLIRAIAPTVLKAVAPAAGMAAADGAAKKVSEVEGTHADLHEEPEGALPSTDGEEHTASMSDVNLTGGSGIGSVEDMGDDGLSPEDPSIQTMGAQDIVAAFQTSAAASTLMNGSQGPQGDGMDLATAAREHLSKLAGTSFSAAEQHALIHESPGVQASNTDRLDIAGTHYAELDKLTDREDDYSWLM